jgi:hypothetical protein
MRDVFFGYYPPTKDQYDTLWKEAVIVLDANVLLDLYRSPPTAREEMLAVLTELKQRLWIPYHAALEFQRQRLTVISTKRKATEDALETAKSLVDTIKEKVEALQLDKYGLGLDPSPLVADLMNANGKLIDAIKAVHENQVDIELTDPIRNTLDSIVSGVIGPGPSDQAELDALTVDGEQRYADKIPPGYADADKEKNPNLANFFHDQIKYQRKFGDLIVWRQLLNHVKKAEIKAVLFVTSEKKEDWWWKEKGKILGGQPELIREIKNYSGVDIFWMYSPAQFLEQSKSYVKTIISDQAVAELQEVSNNPKLFADSEFVVQRAPNSDLSDTIVSGGASRLNSPSEYERIERAVYNWLSEIHEDVIQNYGFPDLIAGKGNLLHGYEVKTLKSLENIDSPQVFNGFLRGYIEVKEEKLSRFTMIVVINIEEF